MILVRFSVALIILTTDTDPVARPDIICDPFIFFLSPCDGLSHDEVLFFFHPTPHSNTPSNPDMHTPSQSSSYRRIGPCNEDIEHATSIGDALPFDVLPFPHAAAKSPLPLALSAVRLEGGHPNLMLDDISAAIMHDLGFFFRGFLTSLIGFAFRGTRSP